MSTSDIAGAAFDASVYSEELQTSTLRETKTAAAVDYFERELEKANEALERLDEKREKFQAHVDGVDMAIEEKKEERDRLQVDLDRANESLEVGN